MVKVVKCLRRRRRRNLWKRGQKVVEAKKIAKRWEGGEGGESGESWEGGEVGGS